MSYSIYNLLPHPIKNIFCSLVAIKKSREKYGEVFDKNFDCLMSNNFSISPDEELNEFLKFSTYNSDFYCKYKDRSIYDFPILKKGNIINSNYSNEIGKPYIITYSSGTTGQPFKIPVTKEAFQREYAFWWYHRSFAGIVKGDKVATFGGHRVANINREKPPFWVYNYYENQLFFSSYHLSDNNLKYYLEELNKFKPQLIHGYPSSIYLIAQYVLENNIELEFIPKMIQTVSESTLDFQRQVIKQAFQCNVYIWYGNTELCGHITECLHGKLHIQQRHSYVRILNEKNEDVKPGQAGKIVATNFNNYCFPLINYDTKDIVKVSKDQTCKCGQEGLIIESIDGRIEDYILLPDGRKIGRLDHIFKHTNNIVMAQIVQNEIDKVIIRINKNSKYNKKDEKNILSEARDRLGYKIDIDLDYNTKIEKNTNAKFRFIKQNIDLNCIELN